MLLVLYPGPSYSLNAVVLSALVSTLINYIHLKIIKTVNCGPIMLQIAHF